MLVFLLALAVTLGFTVVLLLSPMLFRPSPETQRLHAVLGTGQEQRQDRRTIGALEHLERSLTGLGRRLRTSLGVRVNTRSQQRLQAAGLRGASTPDIFFAVQCLVPLFAAFAASFVETDTMFWLFAAVAASLVAPNFWLTEKIRRRRKRIQRSLPDAIDLLVICVDAGLGLDQAILRVCQELAVSHPDIQHELSRVHKEQSAGNPRMEAWQNLSVRNKVKELTSFTNMLLQTDRFGTPIVRALTEFAAELRSKRRQAAEEAAAKTKIKIVFPLVFCIFPCLFIVLLAPAILSIGEGLSQMSK